MRIALCFLLLSSALNSRIRDPFTFCLLEALKYSACDRISWKIEDKGPNFGGELYTAAHNVTGSKQLYNLN